jgi:GNAT superfamily N-acetyltransferase
MSTQPFFLQSADRRQLEAAVAANHRAFFVLRTQAVHGEVHHEDGVTWTFPRAHCDPMILFPTLVPERAGEQLDRIVQFYRERRPSALVGCWSLDLPQPSDLGIRLLARGFQPGWRPCWMALALRDLRAEHPQPAGLRIAVQETPPQWEAPQLPYYDRAGAGVYQTIAALQPRPLWHFVATLDGAVVGQSLLFVTDGPLGVAGIYDVGVVPAARNRGVGKAVVAAACRQAAKLGYAYVLLNATGERMYQQLGFTRIGEGWTWWLNVPRLEANPPSRERVALAEAVGRGDMAALDALGQRMAGASLDTPLANEMSLLELAAHAAQPASAALLVEHGATLDIVVAWELGLRERVVALLANDAGQVNRRRGTLGLTPLHEAVERDDAALARVLLDARPDLSIRDTRYGGTALDWARQLRRSVIAALIEQHKAR